MPKLNDLSRSLVALEQDATLIAVIEMGQSSHLNRGSFSHLSTRSRMTLSETSGTLPVSLRSTGIANISCVTMKISEADFRRNFAATPDSATLYPKTGYSFTTPTRRTSLTSCGT
jgi:hypothetical protein